MFAFLSDKSSAISSLHLAIFVSRALHVETAYLSIVDLQLEIRKHIKIAHKTILAEFRKVGFFNTKYKCSSDYDLYYKLIIKKKLRGSFTSKNQLIGEVASGGYSSKISFLGHLLEETKIRFYNKQNIIIIFISICNALIKKFFKYLFN